MARLSGSDRGQVALVGAFAIAVLLVVLAIVLSSAIEVEALAAHGHGPETTDALRVSAETERAVEAITERTDVNDCTTTVVQVEAWGELAARHAAADGALLSVDGVTCDSSKVTYTFTYATPTLEYTKTVKVLK